MAGVVGALAACTPAAREASPAPPVAQRVTIPFMAPAGASGVDEAVQKMMPGWTAKSPHIAVDWVYSEDMSRDVVAHAAAGDIEDVVTGFMGTQAPQVWFTSGVTMALDALVKTQRVNPKEWYKAVWDAHFVDGKQFSLPWQGQVMGLALYYNKDLFEQAGVKVPDLTWTLDDMIGAAEKLRVVQGSEVKRWGVAPGDGLAGERLPAYTRNFNAEPFSADQRKFTWGEGPEFLRSLTWYSEMMQRRAGVMYSQGGDKANDPAMQSVSRYDRGLVQGAWP
jgi:ABC-type glycerol-3-phosphate transport system substrate-binding protein